MDLVERVVFPPVLRFGQCCFSYLFLSTMSGSHRAVAGPEKSLERFAIFICCFLVVTAVHLILIPA